MSIKIKELLRGATKHYQKRKTGADVPFYQPDQVTEFVQGGDITVVDGVLYTEGDFIVTSYANAAVCIQAAFDFIKTKGGTIHIRAGSYSIPTTISTLGQTKEVTIRGDGRSTALTQAAAVPIFTITSSFLNFRDLTFYGGDFLSDVVLGSLSTAVFSNIVFERCTFFDPLVSITRNRFLLNFNMGTASGIGQLDNTDIIDCGFQSNNLYTANPAGSLQFLGKVAVINVVRSTFGGQSYRAIIFNTDGAAVWSGSHIIITDNHIEVSASSIAKYGIGVYGWREFTNISRNTLVMRAGGGQQVGGIQRVGDPFTTGFTAWDVIADNLIYCSSTQSGSRTIYVHGFSGAQKIEGLSITGNVCEMATAGPNYNVALENCNRVSFESNALMHSSAIDSLNASSAGYSTIGVNNMQYQQRVYADEATSYNVQDQIAKGWAKVESNGTLIGGYNVTSTSHVGVGLYNVNWNRDLFDINKYCPVACADANGGYDVNAVVDSTFNTVGTTRVITFVTDTPGVNDTRFYIVIFGQSVDT